MRLFSVLLGCCLSLPNAVADARQPGIARSVESLWDAESVVVLAGGFALAGMSRTWDHRINGSLEDHPVLEASDFTNFLNKTSVNLPAALMAYGVGKATGNQEVQAASADVLRALIGVQLVVGPIKHAVGRMRPDGSNRRSFPSGHTANAFATAEVLRSRYGWKVGVPMYALGALTAAGRMEENVHHLSDVVAGAAFGYVIGRAVGHHSGGGGRVSVLPTGAGMTLAMRF